MNQNIKFNAVIKEMILDYLNIDAYDRIVTNLYSMDLSIKNNDFQKNFNSFYNVRRDENWRKKYYNYFEKNKKRKDIRFSEILEAISDSNSVESSFASKMLATINPEKPILDKNILNYFGFKIEGLNREKRIKCAIDVYDKIEKEYKKMLKDNTVKNTIMELKKLLGQYELSDTKVLDYILWCKGKKVTK